MKPSNFYRKRELVPPPDDRRESEKGIAKILSYIMSSITLITVCLFLTLLVMGC